MKRSHLVGAVVSRWIRSNIGVRRNGSGCKLQAKGFEMGCCEPPTFVQGLGLGSRVLGLCVCVCFFLGGGGGDFKVFRGLRLLGLRFFGFLGFGALG